MLAATFSWTPCVRLGGRGERGQVGKCRWRWPPTSAGTSRSCLPWSPLQFTEPHQRFFNTATKNWHKVFLKMFVDLAQTLYFSLVATIISGPQCLLHTYMFYRVGHFALSYTKTNNWFKKFNPWRVWESRYMCLMTLAPYLPPVAAVPSITTSSVERPTQAHYQIDHTDFIRQVQTSLC